jgi:Flp pilus assembly protein TadD
MLKLAWSLAVLTLPLYPQASAERAESPLNAPAHTISAELLRYPISAKALHMLQKALRISGSGNHTGAAEQLEKTLAKYPGTGAYVYSLVGVEYLKTGQIPKAVDALEHSVQLLPHDASNHANLGLALACGGQYTRAEPELRRALDLDARNPIASQLLAVLSTHQNPEK